MKKFACSVRRTLPALGLAVVVLFSPLSVRGETDEVYRNLVIFSDVIGEIEKNYVDPVTTDVLIKKAVQGMVRSLDPHSAYLSQDEYDALSEDTKGEFSGIGVVLTIKDDILTVISPIEGTPAHRAGIRAGDVIVRINGESAYEMSINEAVNRIKGVKGSRLTLTILRKGGGDPIDIELERDDIPLESVKSILLPDGNAYVAISNFNENTSRDLIKALDEREAERGGVLAGLILDLRGNPGGLLEQAVAVADVFLREGTVVSIRGREGREPQVWGAGDGKHVRDCPMVVLINGGSASASEIVAGALQDHKRALILGTRSFGKGSVQNIKPLGDGSALKLTVARYYTPSGRSIQAEGIRPDIEMAFARLKKEKAVQSIKEKDLKNHLSSGMPETVGVQPDQDALEPDTGIVRRESLTMRKTPEAAGARIKTLTRGTRIKVLEQMGDDWLKINHDGDTGYIRALESDLLLETDDSVSDEFGVLVREKLLLDNQVKRALELLISHRIFSGIGG
ncbi:S41 family peptidase [Desulfatiferula olefinivorans]